MNGPDLAELLRQIRPDFVSAHPGVPWQEMRGLRNRIAHGYFGIDLGTVWDTVQQDLPALLVQLEQAGP